MDIRVAGIVDDSIVDGPGFRLTVFTQGCPHDCPGCHNPETHPFDGGKIMDADAIVKMMKDNPLLDGITLSGGDPFCQPEPCAYLARKAKDMGLNVWAYTGYLYENLLSGDPVKRALLEEVDVLVDGPFILAQKSYECRWRGSPNQRLIDVKASLKKGSPVLLEE